MHKIDNFRDEYFFLSNFYISAPTMYDGVIYLTSEHAFQAAKTLLLGERTVILNAYSPSLAKKYGRRATLRNHWEDVKAGIMYAIVLDKFVRNKELRKKLLATGDAELIEGNTWGDCIWGVCDGIGENHLGKILMTVRDELRGTCPK